MAPPPMRTWLPWSELANGPPVTVHGFRDILRKYPRSSILRACARLSVLFNYGPDAGTTASDEAVEKWAPLLFHPGLVGRVRGFASQKRVILFQAQLRYLAAEMVRLKPYGSEDLSPIPDGMLGELMLSAGELLYQQHQKPTEEMDALANLVAQFLPITRWTLPPKDLFPSSASTFF